MKADNILVVIPEIFNRESRGFQKREIERVMQATVATPTLFYYKENLE